MATTGDVLGGTAASTTGSPSGSWHWNNPTFALVDSTTVASVTLGGTGDGTYWLHITNFGFAIPSDATINGITVKFRRKSNTANDIVTDSIRLFNSAGAGTLLGAAKPPTYALWPTTAAVETFGGAADLWSWTPVIATINSSTFGVQIAAIDDASGSGDIPAIEVVWINITYTAAGGGPTNSHRSTLMWF